MNFQLLMAKMPLTMANETERGFIGQIDFKVNDKKINWEYHPKHIDICKLILSEPIKPNETINITTPFFL